MDNRGEKTRKKGKTTVVQVPMVEGVGAKSAFECFKVRLRMYNATYRFALTEGLSSTEPRTIKIEQLGDDGRTTNHFDFSETRCYVWRETERRRP